MSFGIAEDSSSRPSPSPTVEPHVVLRPGYLRVVFADGVWADYHLRWLRHRCDRDRHPTTGERTLCSSSLPDTLGVASATVSDGALRVQWSHEAHASVFLLPWLRAHAYALGRVEVAPPPSDLASVTLAVEGRPWSAVVPEALARVRRDGVVCVRRGPTNTAPEDETEALAVAFEALGLVVVPTHFGRIEDLRTDNTTNANTDQLGYTADAIDLHSDQPFLDHPPRYQMLQSIRAADIGGDNALCDARAALRYLDSLDAEAGRLLRTVPVRFHRQQKAFERIWEGPLVARDTGDDFLVRSSYFTVAPYALPFAEMEAWYRAHDRFVRILRDPAHQYRLALAPGDWLLYDNHRMLHARTGFRGGRWVRGVYFDPAP